MNPGREIATEQDLYSQLATGNHISQAAKVVLEVVISKEDLHLDLDMACYIVTGLYEYDLHFDIALKTIVDWVEDNQDNIAVDCELPLGNGASP